MQKISKNCYKGERLDAIGLFIEFKNGKAVWSDKIKMKPAAFVCSMPFNLVMQYLSEGLFKVEKNV